MGNKKNIANKYIESKITTRTLLPEEVWERWSAIQREHFLKDHNIKAGQINTIASTEYYKHLPSYVKTEIQEHIKTDHRYAKGGGVEEWSITNIANSKYLGLIEFQDNEGEYHNFEIMETEDKLVFGGFTNTGFIESGYIEKDGFSTDETLQSLLEDLEVYYNDGAKYTSDIVFNQRMAKGGKVKELKEDDFVWNAIGKKLVIDKVTNDEYFLSGFGSISPQPFSKYKVNNYIKSGEWTLKPKMVKGGLTKGITHTYTIGGL